ncbi:acyl carrier protein [Bacteriovoracaceae bacterium]|nr:acyl carrier protein [Bacteriovoracaceae bacterium]
MKDKVINIIQEIEDIDEDISKIEGLITNGYLDSFGVLSLVAELENFFSVKLNGGSEVIKHLESVDSICKLVESSMEQSNG